VADVRAADVTLTAGIYTHLQAGLRSSNMAHFVCLYIFTYF